MMLKKYRIARGLSLAQLAKEIGVANESVVRRYESGVRMPRPEIIEKIWEFTKGAVTFGDHLAAYRMRQASTAAHATEPSEADAVSV